MPDPHRSPRTPMSPSSSRRVMPISAASTSTGASSLMMRAVSGYLGGGGTARCRPPPSWHPELIILAVERERDRIEFSQRAVALGESLEERRERWPRTAAMVAGSRSSQRQVAAGSPTSPMRHRVGSHLRPRRRREVLGHLLDIHPPLLLAHHADAALAASLQEGAEIVLASEGDRQWSPDPA